MIQIRNVPDDLHRKLKSRAALSSKSLSQYLLDEIEQIASRPDQTEIQARLRTRSSVDPGAASSPAATSGASSNASATSATAPTTTSAADAVREERDSR